MDRTIRFNSNFITYGTPLLLILFLVLLSHSSLFQWHPETLSIAITFDLALTVPLVYLFLIRKKKVPNTTAIPFFIGGLILASYLIPAEHQFYLSLIKQWVVPVVELAALTLVGRQVLKVLKAYKAQKNDSFDFHSIIRQAAGEVLPKRVDKILAFEISIIYYGFFHWKKVKLNANEFSYHRKSGTIAVLAILIFIIWIETFVLHILLQRWSPLAAWVLTILSLYSGFQLFGMLRSLSKRPVSIRKDILLLRYGIMSEAAIPFENIGSVELNTRQLAKEEPTCKLSPLGDLDSHNVLLHLKEATTVEGLYGMKKTCRTLALHLDEKESFKQTLEEAVSESSRTA